MFEPSARKDQASMLVFVAEVHARAARYAIHEAVVNWLTFPMTLPSRKHCRLFLLFHFTPSRSA